MKKRRWLQPGQPVVLVYITDIGFVEETAQFLRYDEIKIKDIQHEIPIFQYGTTEINGLQCFWALPNELNRSIEYLQYEIIRLQIRALKVAQDMSYEIPNKLQDQKIEEESRPRTVIDKLGFDPTDESWLESELAVTQREKNWFKFERTRSVAFYQLMYTHAWSDIVRLYNEDFQDQIDIDQAKKLSVKRMRYIFGSTPLRIAGNSNVQTWKTHARDFEERHRFIEDRMEKWSQGRNGKFPAIKTKQEINFRAGPYLNECIEQIPYYFSDTNFNKIKIGALLRALSYDPKEQYIKLDFPEEIVERLKPGQNRQKPWISDGADYVIMLNRGHIKESLDFLEDL